MIHYATLNDYGKVFKSCTIRIALLVIAFLTFRPWNTYIYVFRVFFGFYNF